MANWKDSTLDSSHPAAMLNGASKQTWYAINHEKLKLQFFNYICWPIKMATII